MPGILHTTTKALESSIVFTGIAQFMYIALNYGLIHIKWRHTEQEHFGPFQDVIKSLNSPREIAPLQDSGRRLQILTP